MSLLSVIPHPVRRALRPVRQFLFPRKPALPSFLAADLPTPSLVGYLTEHATTHIADQADADDAQYGFRAAFAAPISEQECDQIEVRPPATGNAVPEAAPPPPAEAPTPAPAVVGYLRERTTRHVAGFIHYPDALTERVEFQVVCTLPGAERVVAEGVADRFDRVMSALRLGDALYGFRMNYPEPLSAAERDHVEVRPIATGRAIPHDPEMATEWKPIRYVAMDIVDNCNLRCPFCLFDHEPVHKTNAMSDETFAAALQLLPYVGPEGHWLSCLHEASMHPRITEFIQRIPHEHRHVMSYTTNLAKRMPDAYFAALAESGLSNLNISIESRDPAIYERMRKGARHRIFMENWEKLLAAFAVGSAPPPLRYICMAYKSNLREIPELVEYLRNERRAWKVEIRDTYDVAWIPKEFRATEFLDHADWVWLQAALAKHSPHDVAIVLPPGFSADNPPAAKAEEQPPAPPPADQPIQVPADPAPPPVTDDPVTAARAVDMPGMIEARILQDGLMIVYSCPAGDYPNWGKELARVNIREVNDPVALVMALTD